jgi:hypothetical protein
LRQGCFDEVDVLNDVSVDVEGVHDDADDDQMYKMQRMMMKIENYVKESI